MKHVLYPIFQEKSIENGLRYVRGLQVKLIDGDNVNQAKYHKWVRHIFKNKHNTCLISNFSREIDWEWPRYVRGPPSHAHPRWQRQPGQVPQVEDSAWLTLLTSMGMTWGPLTYLRSFPVDFSWKIGCKTCVMYVFENMTYPLVGLGLTWRLLTWHIWDHWLLFENWVLNMSQVCFWEYDIPTCVTWPGWRCHDHDSEASDLSENIPNRLLFKSWI